MIIIYNTLDSSSFGGNAFGFQLQRTCLPSRGAPGGKT